MGRPEPCVVFAQTFVHPHLDEYVDEVLFSEPVVITACEFVEQSASSAAPAVTLVGATTPPSFALEVFVHCDGESKFRRLCQPFLYSHSSSSVLEVEDVVTNHLIVRGSYRSLSLVIYGNTAEDLGQFNIELDDSSLTDLASSSEGKLEELPLTFHPTNLAIEDSISALNMLSIPVPESDISVEVKQFLLIMFKILDFSKFVDEGHKVASTLVSAASSYISQDICSTAISARVNIKTKFQECEELHIIVNEARKELLEVYEVLQHGSRGASAKMSSDCSFFELEADLPDSKRLVDMFSQYFHFERNFSNIGAHNLSHDRNTIFGLSVALFLCSRRESCFQFVNAGGMKQLATILPQDVECSTSIKLLLLGVLEQATRYSIGCEGFLGWWPREDESVPSGNSEGYSQLLRLLLAKPRHDVASLATHILHRLRVYEVASRYESAVLSALESFSTVGRVTSVTLNILTIAAVQLRRLLKLIKSHGPIEDPFPVASASRSLVIQTDGFLSYKATSGFISSSKCSFSNGDIDSHLLSLLKERGFLSLSAALLSSSVLRAEEEHAMEIFANVASSIEAVILSFLFCRPGLIFLLQHPEVSATLIQALRGGNDVNKEDCVPLRYAYVLISKGFFCRPWEVGMIVGLHLRVVIAIDRMLSLTPCTEEFLWILWELCGLSRSSSGRQALLAVGYFPEAVSKLIEALLSVKESESTAKNSGASPVNLAIFHSAAEVIEVIVTDSTASSLGCWIGHAMELHQALNLSPPGSNRKDAPTRLLDWIDAGVVYHKHGVVSLLRFAAILASGGDAQLSSTSILVSDIADFENVVGDTSGAWDIHVMENLGKLISEKSFDGVTLRDSAVAQLTTAFRILAFISEDPAVVVSLYDEGALVVIYVVLVNCRFMLARSSNNYDYLVDEGSECNTTSELLLERTREQSIVDLLLPSLVLLINLLQKLQESKEQLRNTKLMNALLRLHTEVSPKLAACAADSSSPCPDSALSFGAICHLVVSALAFWPVYSWSPGLFHSVLASVQATSMLALGPKETCSLLCLLIDLFPDEGIWHWNNGMPWLSALRMLAIGTLLGPQKERQVNWYLEPGHLEKLLCQLTPYLGKISQIIQHYAISALVIIQDMLRVFIIRIASQKADHASILIRPIFTWITDHISESSPSDIDVYKVHRLLDFLANLLEHPLAKSILLGDGVVQILTRVLEKCLYENDIDGKQIIDSMNSGLSSITLFSWFLPAFTCITLLIQSQTYLLRENMDHMQNLSNEDCVLILSYLLKSCQVLPVGKELLACLAAFGELASHDEGRSALTAFISQIYSNGNGQDPESWRDQRDTKYDLLGKADLRKRPPLICCWTKLLKSINQIDGFSDDAIQAVYALSLASLQFCIDGKSLNVNRVVALKYLFGISDDMTQPDSFPEENINYILDLITLLSSKGVVDDHSVMSVKSLSLLLQKPVGSVKIEEIISGDGAFLPSDYLLSLQIHHMADGSSGKDDYLHLGGLGDKFLWECPETLPDRLLQTNLAAKRKMSSLDGSSKRARGDSSQVEFMNQNMFSRGLTPSMASGSTRRDAFRQRKPNTSRPPSMHVDDYEARERNVDGATNSNVIAVPRVGSSGGRPPSIHVDEFEARKRERQNPSVAGVREATAQLKNASANAVDGENINKSKPLKTDLDDDLQGIDIVFDGEESESDDKLPFPQPDDNLQQPAPAVVEQSSPHSIVEETDSDVNESNQFSHVGAPLTSNVDENIESEYPSRISVLSPEIPLNREPSISSDKKYFEQSDDSKNVAPTKVSNRYDYTAPTNSTGFPTSLYNNAPVSSVQFPADSRIASQNFYPKNNLQHGNVPVAPGSQGLYDQRFLPNQPLPSMLSPPMISPAKLNAIDPIPSQSSPFFNPTTDTQHSLGFQVQSDYLSSLHNISSSLPSSLPLPDSKFSRTPTSSPGGLNRPPFVSGPYNVLSVKGSSSQSLYNQSSTGTAEFPSVSVPAMPFNDARIGNLSSLGARSSSYHAPPLMPSLAFNRPTSVPLTPYGTSLNQQLSDNQPNILQNISIPQTSIQTMHSIGQLQPLQPPQLPRPLQPPNHPRPPNQVPQHLDQGMSMQSSGQVQVLPLQMVQQPQVSQLHLSNQNQQQEFSHAQQQQQVEYTQQGNSSSLTQQDSVMSLLECLNSPEGIQTLLSDRDKLCQLLEQHPKLMQMLQEKLGHL